MFGKSNKHIDLLNRIRSLEDFKTLSPIPKSESIKTKSEKRAKLQLKSVPWEAFDQLANEVIAL
jgi:hypothetical protein